MAEHTNIEWADATVNFWWGCQKVSPACEHCYAETLDARFHPHPMDGNHGLPNVASHWGPNARRLLRVEKAIQEVQRIRRRAINGGWACRNCDWTGGHRDIQWSHDDDDACCPRCGGEPCFRPYPPRVFVNSMSDFFEDRRDLDEARYCALASMFQTPEVTFMLLTKRPEQIWKLLVHIYSAEGVDRLSPFGIWLGKWLGGTPPENIWLGTTAENQEWADKRIPELLKVPAAVRFLSMEPLLGPVDLRILPRPASFHSSPYGWDNWLAQRLHWVITGGESGPHARPSHPDWFRALRDRCVASKIAYFHKQNGEFLEVETAKALLGDDDPRLCDGQAGAKARLQVVEDEIVVRVGKKAAGRLLDGVEHSEFPEVVHA